ncbi:MAG: hypothetical protein ABW352_18230 [Polyangiales bacterium]
MGKRALWFVGALFALSVLAASGMMYLLKSERGNRSLCDFVARKVSGTFQGRLEIDHIDDLRLDMLDARGVRFIPPKGGPPAIDAPHVVLTLSPSKMLQGEFGWTRAVVDHPQVRVTEYENGKTNMEELFASPPKPEGETKPKKDSKPIAMENMVTNQAKLWIGGGSLPDMYLSEIDGIMRIDIDGSNAVLRFDDYKGRLDGLPSGHLDFADVKGQVWTSGKRLLHFDGDGKNKGQPVVFGLDISTKPTDVQIEAEFEEIGIGSLAARMMAAWSKFSPGIDVKVRQRSN